MIHGEIATGLTDFLFKLGGKFEGFSEALILVGETAVLQDVEVQSVRNSCMGGAQTNLVGTCAFEETSIPHDNFRLNRQSRRGGHFGWQQCEGQEACLNVFAVETEDGRGSI